MMVASHACMVVEISKAERFSWLNPIPEYRKRRPQPIIGIKMFAWKRGLVENILPSKAIPSTTIIGSQVHFYILGHGIENILRILGSCQWRSKQWPSCPLLLPSLVKKFVIFFFRTWVFRILRILISLSKKNS